MSISSLHVIAALCLAFMALSGCQRQADTSTSHLDETPSLGDNTKSISETGEATIQATLIKGAQISITILNGKNEPLELFRELQVEQEADDEWIALESVGELWIRGSCSSETTESQAQGHQCLTIEPLTSYEVPPWLGTLGDAQCICERCVPVPAGRYRIVASGCHGQRYVSNAIPIRLREE